ncbi:hypothetical protein PAMP_016008 [Pampus punctatissimus]
MVCVLFPLLLSVLLSETSTSLSLTGTESASSCPPRWLLFGQRCFAFYPVWSSWSTAKLMCSQTGGNLVSLHTAEERQLVSQLAHTHTPVWLGGYQMSQNASWFWSDNSIFRISSWVDQRQEEPRVCAACLEMTPQSGELHRAACEELRFYICSTQASFTISPSNKKPVEPGIVSGVSLFDVLWDHSHLLAEEILRSSSLLKELRSGELTKRCYTSFIQQEALYLHRVSCTLKALISGLQEGDDMRPLLLDTLKHYRSRNQSLPASPPPPWLSFSLQSFHSVVLEEPVYWLVALSARACLYNFLLSYEPRPASSPEANSLYRQWRRDGMKEVLWTHRYRKVIDEHQNHMDVFKAINIFREHMMNQKNLYKAVTCDVEEDGQTMKN